MTTITESDVEQSALGWLEDWAGGLFGEATSPPVPSLRSVSIMGRWCWKDVCAMRLPGSTRIFPP